MAHNVTKTILSDGPSKAVVHFYIEGDGQAPELSNFVILDSKTDFTNSDETSNNIVKMSIQQIWYANAWFDVLLSFDDLPSYPSWICPRDADTYFDFRYFGGLKDRSSVDGNGKLLLTTNGLAVPGAIGTMVVELKKN